MSSLKSKFSLIITLLIIVVIGATSGVLVQQKKTEIENDIYLNARSFGELTADDIAASGALYLPEENFLPFQRDLAEIMKKNADIQGAKIYSFAGDVLFDYEVEGQQQYSGPARTVSDSKELDRIKASNLSLKTQSGKTYFIEKLEAGVYRLTDINGKPIPEAEQTGLNLLENLIVPVNNEYAVQYDITYINLQERLLASAKNIGVIAVVGILMSIIFGFFMASFVTKPLADLTELVGVIAKGDFKKRAKIKSKDEVGQLAGSVNKMAQDLEKATEAKIYQERVKKELEIAGEIQKNFLPKELPEIKGLDVAGELIPATEVGGDVYDIVQDKKGNSYFYVGDVTGHGVPAGLLSALTNAIITSTIDNGDLDEIMVNLNRVLRMKTPGNLFLTLLLMKFSGSALEYVSAGHEQIVHYKASKKEVELKDAGGIALAMVDDIKEKVKPESLKMDKGDVVLLYTDGIPEAWKNKKEQYGFDRLKGSLEKYGSLQSAEEIKKALLSDLKKFTGNYEQKDDITLVVLKKK